MCLIFCIYFFVFLFKSEISISLFIRFFYLSAMQPLKKILLLHAKYWIWPLLSVDYYVSVAITAILHGNCFVFNAFYKSSYTSKLKHILCVSDLFKKVDQLTEEMIHRQLLLLLFGSQFLFFFIKSQTDFFISMIVYAPLKSNYPKTS